MTAPLTSLAALPAPTPAPAAARPSTVREVAESFEAMFIAQMLAPMFSGIATDGPLGGGHGETIYRSLLVDEYGSHLSKRGGIGIADSLERYLLGFQEISS